jgi:hypothetical protein
MKGINTLSLAKTVIELSIIKGVNKQINELN